MNEDLKKKKLRFPDENGEMYPEWEEKKLGEVGTPKKNYTFSRADEVDDDTGVRHLHYGNIHSNKASSTQLSCIEKKENFEYLEEGDLVIADASEDRADLGKAVVFDGEHATVAGLHTKPFSIDGETANSLFIKNSFRTRGVVDYLRKTGTGISVFGLTNKSVAEIPISLPSLPEQSKIAELLSKIDEKIEAQAALVELRKQQKRAYMQRILGVGGTPRLRFKADDGTDYPDWEEKMFSGVFERISVRGDSSLDYVTVMKDKTILRSMGNQGYGNEMTDEKKKGSKVVRSGDFLIDLTSYERGILLCLMDGLTSNAYSVLRAKEGNVSGFWKEFLVSHDFVNSLSKITPVGARQGKMIEVAELMNFTIPVPSLPEQEKIAAFLSGLDDRIVELEKALQSLKNEKNGYLQRMLG